MSIYDALPESISIDGKEYGVNTDFRVWIEIDRLLCSGNRLESITKAVMLCYKSLPPNLEAAVYGILDFYRGEEVKAKKEGDSSGKRIYDFYADSGYIYASFLSEYGLDLSACTLHWHRFKALFAALGENSCIVRIMRYRSMDLSRVKDREQRRFYRRMKAVYALPDNRTDEEKERDLIRELDGLF